MLNLTPQGQSLVSELAATYGVSADAVATVMQAVIRGNGRAAQFSHPDFGGHCQWMSGGMVMAGSMNDHALKSKIDALCSAIAARLHAAPDDAESASLYIPDASRSVGHWWPFALGSPAAAGSQNKISYALFPDAHRLAVEVKGHVSVYDTRGHSISGLSQQGGDETTLSFITPGGVLHLSDLPLVDGEPRDAAADAGNATAREEAAPVSVTVGSHDDILGTIERLAALKDRGILTAEEFADKKAELLRRL